MQMDSQPRRKMLGDGDVWASERSVKPHAHRYARMFQGDLELFRRNETCAASTALTGVMLKQLLRIEQDTRTRTLCGVVFDT